MTKKKNPAYISALSVLNFFEEEGYSARLVGGCVRDRLLGVQPKDYDIATGALPEESIEVLNKFSVKVIPTGLEHGTVTAVFPANSIEITTLRKDVETDGRRAVVKFGKSFEEDAERRDFTINSLSEDLRGKVFDYFKGEKHLKEKKLVFVGDPETRIKEDFLRILRLYRFKARFNFTFDKKLEEIILKTKEGLAKVSQERITAELEETLNSPYFYKPFESMSRAGLWGVLFPFLEEKDLLEGSPFVKNILAYCKKKSKEENEAPFLLVLSALFILSSRKKDEAFLRAKVKDSSSKLKLSNSYRSQIETLVLGFFASQKIFKDQADLLLFAKACERRDQPNFFRDVCTPFWIDMGSLKDDSKEIKKKLRNNLLVYSKNKEKLVSKPPLSTKEIMALLKKKEGAELGKILEDRTRVYLNGAIKDEEEMKNYLLKKYK